MKQRLARMVTIKVRCSILPVALHPPLQDIRPHRKASKSTAKSAATRSIRHATALGQAVHIRATGLTI